MLAKPTAACANTLLSDFKRRQRHRVAALPPAWSVPPVPIRSEYLRRPLQLVKRQNPFARSADRASHQRPQASSAYCAALHPRRQAPRIMQARETSQGAREIRAEKTPAPGLSFTGPLRPSIIPCGTGVIRELPSFPLHSTERSDDFLPRTSRRRRRTNDQNFSDQTGCAGGTITHF